MMLNGHTDTVGVDYMTIDPFDPVIKDGKLYGRGSFDMKGGLASSMAAVKAIVNSGDQMGGDVIVAAVCDEEFASIGTEHLMKDTRVDAAIIGEPTFFNVQVAHKGTSSSASRLYRANWRRPSTPWLDPAASTPVSSAAESSLARTRTGASWRPRGG